MNPNPFNDLPEELLVNILFKLDFNNLISARTCCSGWCQSSHDGHIWKPFAKELNLPILNSKKNPETLVLKAFKKIKRITVDFLNHFHPKLKGTFPLSRPKVSFISRYKETKSFLDLNQDKIYTLFCSFIKSPENINLVRSLTPYIEEFQIYQDPEKMEIGMAIRLGSFRLANYVLSNEKRKRIENKGVDNLLANLPEPFSYEEAIKQAKITNIFIKEGVIDLSKITYSDEYVEAYLKFYQLENNPHIDELLTFLKPHRSIKSCLNRLDLIDQETTKHLYFHTELKEIIDKTYDQSETYMFAKYLGKLIREILQNMKFILEVGFKSIELECLSQDSIDLFFMDENFLSGLANKIYSNRHSLSSETNLQNGLIKNLLLEFKLKVDDDFFYTHAYRLRSEQIHFLFQSTQILSINPEKILYSFISGFQEVTLTLVSLSDLDLLLKIEKSTLDVIFQLYSNPDENIVNLALNCCIDPQVLGQLLSLVQRPSSNLLKSSLKVKNIPPSFLERMIEKMDAINEELFQEAVSAGLSIELLFIKLNRIDYQQYQIAFENRVSKDIIEDKLVLIQAPDVRILNMALKYKISLPTIEKLIANGAKPDQESYDYASNYQKNSEEMIELILQNL